MVKDKLDELLIYFDPVQINSFKSLSFRGDQYSMGNSILINSDEKPLNAGDRFEVALLFIDQFISDDNIRDGNSIQTIREEIYRLKKISSTLRIADLGNLKKGKTPGESFYIIREVCSILFHLNINVVLIGGSQSFTIPALRALEEFENDINLVHIDARIDLNTASEEQSVEFYLNEIIENDASHLYNIACVGHQSYFVDQKQINRLNELYFEHYRLGIIKNNFEEIEPVLRDADIISFDIGAVKAADAPARVDPSPNGFMADEACRLTRYAGISDKVRLFGLYEINLGLDINNQTAKLAAQMIWYYLEGFLNRKHEYPSSTLDDCIKYIVEIDEIEIPIVFYKSNKTQRWWIEINNLPETTGDKVNVIASCTETDYFKACNNEIPDRWWLNFKKLR